MTRVNARGKSKSPVGIEPSSGNGPGRPCSPRRPRCRESRAPGLMRGFASSQSVGRRKPSPSRSRFTASPPLQSSSMPLSSTSITPGRIAGLPSSQSPGLAAPSPSASGDQLGAQRRPFAPGELVVVSASPVSASAPQSTSPGGRRGPAACPPPTRPGARPPRRRRRAGPPGAAVEPVGGVVADQVSSPGPAATSSTSARTLSSSPGAPSSRTPSSGRLRAARVVDAIRAGPAARSSAPEPPSSDVAPARRRQCRCPGRRAAGCAPALPTSVSFPLPPLTTSRSERMFLRSPGAAVVGHVVEPDRVVAVLRTAGPSRRRPDRSSAEPRGSSRRRSPPSIVSSPPASVADVVERVARRAAQQRVGAAVRDQVVVVGAAVHDRRRTPSATNARVVAVAQHELDRGERGGIARHAPTAVGTQPELPRRIGLGSESWMQPALDAVPQLERAGLLGDDELRGGTLVQVA